MKKIFALIAFTAFFAMNAQETANRFFYELTFKPKKDSAKVEKVMTILDITKDKSLYRDYTIVAQDSILKLQVEAMQKSGAFKDISKSITMPKFSEKIYKFYPDMKVQFVDRISSGFTPVNIGYSENLNFNWKIDSQKEKIGEYNAQKATADFGGRKWTAWFTTDIPFQDGPYKFHGLPGLIVKISDDANNYSWELKGNKKIPNYNEVTYVESVMPGGNGGKVQELSREKFTKTWNDYKKDPFATMRPLLTQQMLSMKMPGMDGTMGDYLKQQEKTSIEFYKANDNPIEIVAEKPKK
ncbi:GLPGLI family protein [Chryseobacterium sp. H3056]|jgi:GLPGLI family protein|uniref:GLPGLI family protein n=1 Tax=Kaistella daneshvariae TaxID=2487074 RepID=A0A3N0WS26_9FLAO|nr:GLPGLI family protein [Kaistella daneshvariae]ROI07907.1 GLPGLI family protein [Kaistella daneshvariae]